MTQNRLMRYRIQEYYSRDMGEFDNYLKTLPPGGRTNAWWPHYSLHPSLVRMAAIRCIGRYDESARHFELEYATRYQAAGFKTAFMDSINVLHIGKQPWDRCENMKNAYELNNQNQFG